MDKQCKHEWVVFSTAVADVYIMVQCCTCGSVGVIKESTMEEWGEAFYAPSRPYRWRGRDERVEDIQECEGFYIRKA